jgi:hypothetical protein
MSYRLNVPENEVFGKGKYKNARGLTECVEFVRQVTNAPATTFWKSGPKVADAKPGEILRGTAIATFDDSGGYPTDSLGQHAAIYLYHTQDAITVLN